MIRLEKLCFGYNDKGVLFNDLNLWIKPEDNVLLKGENGCGKSTLLKLIMGLFMPLSGTVRIMGMPVTKLDAALFKHLYYQSQTTSDNLLGISRQQDWQLWRMALPNLPECCDGISEHSSAQNTSEVLFSELSSGEQKQESQHILAYLMDKFWLLDEPFASLDSRASDRLFSLMTKKMKEKPGMLVVAHEFGDREASFDKVLFLENGELKWIEHAYAG